MRNDIDWHLRCRDCGHVAIWLTHYEAWLWAKNHTCPPQPNPTQGEPA